MPVLQGEYQNELSRLAPPPHLQVPLPAPRLGLRVPALEYPEEVRDKQPLLSKLPEEVKDDHPLFPALAVSLWAARVPCEDQEGPDTSLEASNFRPASLQA